MSVLSSPPKQSPANPVVKHPLTWYMPRFWHGMRFSTWIRELVKNRFAISPSRVPMTCAITCFSLFNSLLAGIERTVYGRRIDAADPVAPPIFILGHWRSGTTFLHELMICDPEHGFPTTYQCFAPHHFVLSEKWVTPWSGFFVPAQRPMDNMAAGWNRPMEDEFALENLGTPTPYLSMMFPNHEARYEEYLTLRNLSEPDRAAWKKELLQFCRRLTYVTNKRIVLKSPGHTARIRTLLEMFPKARFVHITRDPYTLFASTVSLWRSLNHEQGLQVVRNDAWVEDYVIDSLRRMYDAYLEDRQLLGSDQLYELRYENLVGDPKGELRSLYEQLGLGDFARMEPKLDAHLSTVKNYRTNRHQIGDDAQRDRLRKAWAPYFESFGYT